MASSSSPTPPSAGSPPTPAIKQQQQQQQQQQPTQNNTLNKQIHENPLLRPVALVVTPLALLGLCLPPRRLDMRAVLLGGVGVWGTNQLALEYTGKSFAQRTTSRLASLSGLELPEKAKEAQAKLREEKERRERLRAIRDEMVRSGAAPAPAPAPNGKGWGYEGWTDAQKTALLEAYERRRREEEEGEEEGEAGMIRRREGPKRGDGKEKEKGLFQRIWMGDAEPDWKEKRDQREREALQEGGGGYWGLITDQIAEVWNGAKKTEGDSAKGKTEDDAKK